MTLELPENLIGLLWRSSSLVKTSIIPQLLVSINLVSNFKGKAKTVKLTVFFQQMKYTIHMKVGEFSILTVKKV